MNIKIRREEEQDYDKVYNVIKLAFENAEHTDHNEQNLVTRLRKSESFIPELSIVAEKDNKIIGYILFTKINIGNNEGVALAPLAVLPEFQRKEVGSKLIIEGHKIAKELGYKVSVVLGHEKYYPRFGYSKASLYNIKAPFEVPEEAFMVIELKENQLNYISGKVEYAKEFFE